VGAVEDGKQAVDAVLTLPLSAGRGSIGHEMPDHAELRRMCSFRGSRDRRQAGTVVLDADTTLVTRECGFACVAQESGFAFASVRSKTEGRAKNGDVSVASMATVYVSVYVPSRVSFVDSVLNLFEERHLRGVESVPS
jgi:hypothetical protein